MSVAVWDDHASRLRATSGLESFDSRANTVRRLEQLLDALLAYGTRSWWTSDETSLPPGVATCLQAYFDAAHVRQLAVLPLLDTANEPGSQPELLGGPLILDRFDGEPLDDSLRQRAWSWPSMER